MVAGARSGFHYVLDAFCAINVGEVPMTFFRKGVNPILLRVSYDRLGQTLVAESGIRCARTPCSRREETDESTKETIGYYNANTAGLHVQRVS